MTIAATPKSIIGLSVLLLGVAAVFGVLNTQKVKTLRGTLADANAARDAADRRRLEEEKQIKARETAAAAAVAKAAETETKVAKAEAELVQLQTEKTDLQAKLQANQTEISDEKAGDTGIIVDDQELAGFAGQKLHWVLYNFHIHYKH